MFVTTTHRKRSLLANLLAVVAGLVLVAIGFCITGCSDVEDKAAETTSLSVTAEPSSTRIEAPSTGVSDAETVSVKVPTVTASPVPASTATPIPTSTVRPIPTGTATPMPTSLPTPQEPAYGSGGLGLELTAWQERHERTGEGLIGDEYDGFIEVSVMDGRLWHIELLYDTDHPVAKAREDAAALMPVDAQPVETYSPEGIPELQVDLYHSDSLANRFGEDLFMEGAPGDFIVVMAVYGGKVSRVVIATGNNP